MDIIKKFLTDKNHITMADCGKILEKFGYVPIKSAGSHRGYHQKGCKPIIIVYPKHSKYVTISYVKRIIAILKLEG